MKNHWKLSDIRFSIPGILFLLLFLITSCYETASAKTVEEEQLDTLSFIEMINSVDLGEQSEFIQQFQNKEARAKLLSKFNGNDGCSVENYRNKEVLLITIPARLLFAPNETLLANKASDYLSTFKRYLKDPDTYRVLLVMHTDNTGSQQYRDDITEERVESIFEYFQEQGCDTSFLFPYAMSDDMPIYENDSQKSRDANRRLEIYLMPGKKMLEQAKKGRIEF